MVARRVARSFFSTVAACVTALIAAAGSQVGPTSDQHAAICATYGDNDSKSAAEEFVAQAKKYGFKSRLVQDFSGSTPSALYFYDSRYSVTGMGRGMDDDPQGVNGGGFLFLDVAHGDLSSFQGQGVDVSISLMRLGRKGTPLRYFWNCSCRVLGHGPSPDDNGYRQPVDFPGPIDVLEKNGQLPDGTQYIALANAIVRWGQSLGDDFRVVCGGSTDLDCSTDRMSQLWLLKAAVGLDVADAFLVSLAGGDHVPLCLTRSVALASSPLFDHDFEHGALALNGNIFVDVEYPVVLSPQISSPLPSTLPSGLDFIAMSPASGVGLDGAVLFASPSAALSAGGVALDAIDDHFGNINVSEVPSSTLTTEADDNTLIASAKSFVRDHGWMEDDLDLQQPYAMKLYIDSIRWGEPKTHYLKNVVVSFTRKGVALATSHFIHAQDDGALVLVELNRTAQVVRGYKHWRRLATPLPNKPVDIERQIEIAKRSLPEEGRYSLAEARIIYSPANANLEVPRLVIDFAPGKAGFQPKSRTIFLFADQR